MQATTSPTVLDCGHEPSPHADFTVGYGTDEQGCKHCYACCLTRDLARLKTDTSTVAYVNGDATAITNWPGGKLMTITKARNVSGGGWHYGPVLYVRARDEHGQQWYGRGPGKGMYIKLHKVKAKQD